MNEDFLYLGGIESVSNLEFFKIGTNNIYPPSDGNNIGIDMYFIATPEDLLTDIEKLKIISQYTIFYPTKTYFAHFNIVSTFELITKLKSLNEDKLKMLILKHQQDCLKHTNYLTIFFGEDESITLPRDCVLSPESVAQDFAPRLYHKRNQTSQTPFLL